MTPEPLPIACTLTADAFEARRGNLADVLRGAVSSQAMEDGMSWRFETRPGLMADLSSLIDAERACCRFLAFTLRADAGDGPVTLEVTGPPGTREFLRTWVSAP